MTSSSMADRLKDIRKGLGLNQQDFASNLQVSQSYIAAIEVGRKCPSRDFICALRNNFNVSANWLLFGHGPMYFPSHDAENAKLEKSLKEKLDTTEYWAHPPYPALIHREFETDLTILKSASAVHSCKPFSAEEVVVEQTEEERDAAARMLAANIKMQFDNALENTPRAPSVVFLFLIGGFCGLWLLFFKLIGVL